jgi:hypothetical protein
LVRAAEEDSTQRKNSKELTNIASSVTPIITAPPPELQKIIHQWGNLPEHIKQTIGMLVETVGKKSNNTL